MGLGGDLPCLLACLKIMVASFVLFKGASVVVAVSSFPETMIEASVSIKVAPIKTRVPLTNPLRFIGLLIAKGTEQLQNP